MIKLVIFDIDGTLVDAYGAITKSLNYALKKMGYPPASRYRAQRTIGFGDRDFIDHFFKPEDAERALTLYRSHHAKALLRHSRVLRGVKQVLARLKRKGCRLAIVSNRPDPFCGILLDHLDLVKYFDMIVCARHRREIKPSPVMLDRVMRKLRARPDETIFVGDMVVDVEAGRSAGIRTIAITGGSSSKRELIRAKPFKIIYDVKSLTTLFESAKVTF